LVPDFFGGTREQILYEEEFQSIFFWRNLFQFGVNFFQLGMSHCVALHQ
jgi:hypothetical protein